MDQLGSAVQVVKAPEFDPENEPESVYAQGRKSAKLAWWHTNLALWMMQNPQLTMKDAAKFFKCTPQTLYLIKNSDSFKAFYAEQTNKLMGAGISWIVEKTAAMTEMALDKINDQLEAPGNLLDITTLHKIADGGLKRLGYGAPKIAPGPQVTVNVGAVVDRDVLAAARQKMKELHGCGDQKAPLELEAHEVVSVGPPEVAE